MKNALQQAKRGSVIRVTRPFPHQELVLLDMPGLEAAAAFTNETPNHLISLGEFRKDRWNYDWMQVIMGDRVGWLPVYALCQWAAEML